MATNNEIEKLERRWLENPLGLTFASLAEAYRKSGEPGKALETLEVGLAQHPNYVPAHIVRGRCHLDAGDHVQAELAFNRVVELDPENPIALKSLADLAETEGRLPEAVGRLQALLEVDRNNEEARGQLEHVRELMSGPEPSRAGAAEPLDLSELPPSRMIEFQLPDDAAELSPSNERFPEILLQAELAEDLLPAPEAAQGADELTAPDPLAASGAETPLDELPDSVTTPSLEATPEQAEVEVVVEFEAATSSEPEPVPVFDAEPETAPEPEPELELVPAAELEPDLVASAASEPEPPEVIAEPEPAYEPEAGAPAEPELVVTETMAEIFLRQGHRELALAVYTQLAQRDPGNERVKSAVSQLQAELAPPVGAAAPSVQEPVAAPQPRYDAAATGGRSVAQLFGSLLSAARPSVAAAVHPPAFESSRPAAGEPTRATGDALSLSAVFGEEATPAGPAGGAREPAANEPSFEQFFTPAEGSTGEVQLPKSPDDHPVMSSLAPEDLEQFNAWLRGLKR